MQVVTKALERAFELAKSGACTNASEIKSRLKAEGFSDSSVVGWKLSRQLKALIASARAVGRR
jgi:hypothetical protein